MKTLARVLFGSLAALGCGDRLDSEPQGLPGEAQQALVGDIAAQKELLITDLSVVNDVKRTTGNGAWSFGKLMTDMAGAQDAATFVENWLRTWERDFSANGAVAAARPNVNATLLDSWPRKADGKLDLTKAPFRLLAIVHRPDLRNVAAAPFQAGEGRFVFGALGPTGTPLSFTLILEYSLPGKDAKAIRAWAESFHKLGSKPFGSGFNDQLQALTDGFAKKDKCGDRVNKSCINQVRSNEVSLSSAGLDPANTPSTKLWELREFRLAPSGALALHPVAQTPDISFKGTGALTDFINANSAAIIAGKHSLPTNLQGPSAAAPKGAFLSGDGIDDSNARFRFAFSTCDGCHTTETGTSFLHIRNRAADAPSVLSAFFSGVDVADPYTGETRTFNELASRVADLRWVLFTATDADLGKAPPKKTH